MPTNTLYATVLEQNIHHMLEVLRSGHYQFDECKKQLDEYIVMAKSYGLAFLEIDAIATLGTLYMNHGQLDDAMACTRQSYEQSVAVNYTKGIDRGLNNMGTIFDRAGQFEQALAYYKDSLEVTRNSDELRPTIMISYLNLVGSLLNLNRIDEADVCLQQAIETYENMSLRDLQHPDVFGSMGQIYSSKALLELELGRYLTALDHAQSARQFIDTTENTTTYYEAESTLLKCIHFVTPDSPDEHTQMRHLGTIIHEFIKEDRPLGAVYIQTLDDLEYWLTKNNRTIAQFFADQAKLVLPYSAAAAADQERMHILLDRLAATHYL